MVNSQNSEETLYNQTLLNIANEMESWLLDPVNRKINLDNQKFKSEGELMLLETIEKSITGRMAKSKLGSAISELEKLLKYKGINYSASIYVPNHQTADFTLEPIVAIGTDIENSNEDVIPAWYYNHEGYKTIITLSEDEAMNSIRPVYIINGSSQPKNSTSNVTEVTNSSATGSRLEANPYYYLDNYSIAHRYESDNKSEYSYVLGYRRATGGFQYFHHRDVRKIHKNDLNVVYTSDFHISEVNYLFFDIDRLYVATYEHDWYVADKKWIDWGNGVGAEIMRAKFANEWYQKGWMDAPKPLNPVVINSKGTMTIK